jgi:hypothetical protein
MRLYNSTGLRNALQPHNFFCHRIIPRFSFSAHLPLCNHTAFFDDAQVLMWYSASGTLRHKHQTLQQYPGTAAGVMLQYTFCSVPVRFKISVKLFCSHVDSELCKSKRKE